MAAKSYDVYLSYPDADIEWIYDWLLPRFELTGVTAAHADTFPLGVSRVVNTERAVGHCRYTLVFLSPEWLSSTWSQFEWLLTYGSNPAEHYRRLIPIRLRACDPQGWMGQITAIDWVVELRREEMLPRLLAILRGELHPEELVPRPTFQLKPRALHQLRAPVADFLGRKQEIARLEEMLRTGTNTAISGIRGMGGIGKTELAYAVAQHLTNCFPDAQLVISLRGASPNPLTPEQALQSVIHAFEPDAIVTDTLDTLQAYYCSLLHGKRVLILADDAHNIAQVRPLLPPSGSALLITSRQRFTLPGMLAQDLDTLSPSDAEALLVSICPRIRKHAVQLANLCGYLPLALRISASLLQDRPGRSVRDYLEQLEDKRMNALQHPDDPEASIEASLSLSYEALTPTQQTALCQLGVFVSSFDIAAAKAIVTIEKEASLEEALEILQNRSLLEWNASTERYQMHDLVRAFARTRLDDENLVFLQYATYYAHLATQANELYKQGEDSTLIGLELFDRERSHITYSCIWLQEQTPSEQFDRLTLVYADTTALIGDLRFDKKHERIPLLKGALQAAQRLGDKEAENALLGNIGITYTALGDFREGVYHYEARLAQARSNANRDNEAKALGNLGSAYRNLGNLPLSIQHYKQALNIRQDIPNPYDESILLDGLGSAYRDNGSPNKAIPYHEQALYIRRELGNRRGEGISLGQLGSDYERLGDWHKAISYHEQNLHIAEEIGDPRGAGIALGLLGKIYMKLGDYATARMYYERSIECAQKTHAYWGEIMGYWGIGLLLVHKGQLKEALPLMELRVNYERKIGHYEAELHTTQVEQLRQKLKKKDEG